MKKTAFLVNGDDMMIKRKMRFQNFIEMVETFSLCKNIQTHASENVKREESAVM